MYSPSQIEKIRTLLRRWLEEQGLIIEQEQDSVIVVREGNNTVYLRLYIPQDFLDPDDITRTIIEMSRLRQEYNKMYVVVPRDLLHYLDGKLLKKCDIGVISVDVSEQKVEEVLKSPPVKTYVKSAIPEIDIQALIERVVREHISQIVAEVRQLKARLDQVEAKITNLERSLSSGKSTGAIPLNISEELSSVWSVIDRLKLEVERLKDMCSSVSTTERVVEKKAEIKTMRQEVTAQVPENVPEYLVDNPWVQIIANKAVENEH